MTEAIDIFAGLGGGTEGLRRGGLRVVAALNHWPEAVRVHAANNPDVRHFCDDALTFDFRDLPRHTRGHLSPACTYFTNARAGHAADGRDESRATALCVARYVEACEPAALTVENVFEFGASPERAAVARRLRRAGYRGRVFRLDSADFGCAQSRRRWFEVWLRGRAVPRWAPPVRAAGERRPLLDVLDAAASWSPVDAAARRARGLRPLAPNTLRQVAAGGERFGGGVFVVRYNGSQRKRAVVYSPAAPLGALTTRDRFCLGRGGGGTPAEIRTLTLREMARLFDLPESYGFAGASRPDAVKLAGNALVASVLEWLHLRISEVAG